MRLQMVFARSCTTEKEERNTLIVRCNKNKGSSLDACTASGLNAVEDPKAKPRWTSPEMLLRMFAKSCLFRLGLPRTSPG